jgi:hypothetical protein
MDIMPTVQHPEQLPKRVEIDYEQERYEIAAEGGFVDDVVEATGHGEFDIRKAVSAMAEGIQNVVEVQAETGTQVCWATEYDGAATYVKEGVADE